MSLFRCASCTTDYASGLEACPNCGSGERGDAVELPVHVSLLTCTTPGCRAAGEWKRIVRRYAGAGVLELIPYGCAVCGCVMDVVEGVGMAKVHADREPTHEQAGQGDGPRVPPPPAFGGGLSSMLVGAGWSGGDDDQEPATGGIVTGAPVVGEDIPAGSDGGTRVPTGPDDPGREQTLAEVVDEQLADGVRAEFDARTDPLIYGDGTGEPLGILATVSPQVDQEQDDAVRAQGVDPDGPLTQILDHDVDLVALDTTPDPDLPAPLVRPAASAPKPAWSAYVIARGLDETAVAGMTKPELVAWYPQVAAQAGAAEAQGEAGQL